MSQPIFKDGIGYEGKVTLTLKSNNRILKSKIYKNSGTTNLFKFLGLCLVDSYDKAKAFLPTQIMLLHNKSAVPESSSSKNVESRSSYQGYLQQPTYIIDEDSAEVKVRYSFEVPKTAIESGLGMTFNQVALYRAQPDNYMDFSAYYFLTDSEGNFANQDTSDWSATTILLIEWELALSNKNIIINNSNREDD